MSAMEQDDDILVDPNGNNAVEIEATTTTTSGFFANILKKVWPSRETKYELKYRTRKASDGAKSDTSSIWSKLTGFLAQDGTGTSISGVSSPTSNASSPRDSIMTEDDNENKSFENNDGRQDSAFSVRSTKELAEAAAVRPLLKTTTRKSFSEEFKGVRTRKEVLFSKEYRKRRSRNLNELYERKGDERNGNLNQNVNNWRQSGGGCGDGNNRVSLIVTSPSDENLREENLNEVNSLRNARQNYNVNEMDMGFMCRSGIGSDVVITCQGQHFQAHSFVLKAQSGHFRRMLFTKSDTKPIVINQLLPQDMEALLLYMYTGRIAKNYSTIHGELTQRFEMMLEDFDVPFPDGTEPLCE